jgi:hypothetical protein
MLKQAQATRDALNTQGANTEGSAREPETKARARTEGSTGGTKGGMKTEEERGRRRGWQLAGTVHAQPPGARGAGRRPRA